MLVCAAVKIKFKDKHKEVVIPCLRHGNVFEILVDLGIDSSAILWADSTDGFLTNDGQFLNRKEALDYAKSHGQLPRTVWWYKEDHNDDGLFSEDLY